MQCGGTTHVLRLGWSPDGLYLVSAHSMNFGFPTAQIIERDGWKVDKDFVGHRKAVVCVVRCLCIHNLKIIRLSGLNFFVLKFSAFQQQYSRK